LNKNSVPLVIETKLLDEESYHGDSEDNDNLNEAYTKIIDDESYHGDSEDNENLEEEILGNIDYPLNNEKKLTLYHSKKSNDLNLTKDKLRLAQRFIRCPGTFYEFSRYFTLANSVNAIYDFMTTDNLGDETDNLRDKADNLRDKADNLRDNIDNLGDNADNLRYKANNLRDNTDNLGDGTDNLRDKANNLRDNVDDMRHKAYNLHYD